MSACFNCNVIKIGVPGVASIDVPGENYMVSVRVMARDGVIGVRKFKRVSFCQKCFLSLVGTALLPMFIAVGTDLAENREILEKIGDKFRD